MKYNLLFIFFSAINFLFAQNFNQYFENKSLRIDVNLTGDAKNVLANVVKIKEEPYYGGSHQHLIFPDYGNFRVQVFIQDTVIYSKGFDSLFREWQSTEVAQTNYRSFYHIFQIPFPKHKIIFELQRRNREGIFEPILTKIIDPKDYFILKEKSIPFEVKEIVKAGKSENKVDLVLLAEGYTPDELDKFYQDAQRMMNYMFSIPPFDQLKNQFNVYAIGSTSEESGTDIPGEKIYKNTLFNSTFYTFDTPRYLTSTDMEKISDVAALVPYDQIYVLVNTKEYGGGGFYNFMSLTSVDHALSEKVFVHEFGHGLAGLADEYYDSSTAFNDIYNQHIEPWEANITTLVDFDKKWKSKLQKHIPIPTPRTKGFKEVLGVFEGGGYVAKGIYSPAQDCRMKSNESRWFCEVCSDAIEKTIWFYCD
jgi:hypothetical protein